MSALTRGERTEPAFELDVPDLRAAVAEATNRWPAAGVAVAVVRDGRPAWFHGHGVADIRTMTPITPSTVFRVGSITKTFTAVAVMQLSRQGLVDLDRPANDYLRAFRLVPAKPEFAPATVRHLLTHTAGVGYWRRLSDLLRPGVGSGDRAGRRPVGSLAEYYRRGLPIDVEPGTRWAYSNHGFAALGQIVEDVAGEPLDRYLRHHVFDPLGMEHTDLTRSGRVRPGLATGYVLRSGGLKQVVDREVLTPGGSAAYSTPADLTRYVAALLNGGANEHGSILEADTVALMFQPHFRPDPRTAGMGLGFEPNVEGGHRTVAKGGTMSGFLSAMVLAPDDATGVVALTNTGGLDNRGVAEPLAMAVLRRLLGLPEPAARPGIAARPEVWHQVCGWYAPDAGPVTNLFQRAIMGAGAEVTVERGHLTLKPLTPIPAMRRGLRLQPDDADDPWVFRVELPDFGITSRVVFCRPPGGGAATRLLMDVMSFERRPEPLNPRRWVDGLAVAGAAALYTRRRHRSR